MGRDRPLLVQARPPEAPEWARLRNGRAGRFSLALSFVIQPCKAAGEGYLLAFVPGSYFPHQWAFKIYCCYYGARQSLSQLYDVRSSTRTFPERLRSAERAAYESALFKTI